MHPTKIVYSKSRLSCDKQMHHFLLEKISIQSTRKNVVSEVLNGTASIVVGDRFSGVQGKKIEISCPFFGTPHPRAAWFFKGRVIDHIKFSNLDITEPNGVSVLTIINLDQKHVGGYTCMVFNQHGRMSSTAHVRLIGRLTRCFLNLRLRNLTQTHYFLI